MVERAHSVREGKVVLVVALDPQEGDRARRRQATEELRVAAAMADRRACCFSLVVSELVIKADINMTIKVTG